MFRVVFWVLIGLVFFGCNGSGLSPSSGVKAFRVQQDDSVGKPFVQMGHSGYINSITISSDNRYIVSGSNDKTIKLWDTKSGREIKTFKGHSGRVTSVAISSNNKYIISGSGDKTIKLWDIKSGKEIKTFKGHSFANKRDE